MAQSSDASTSSLESEIANTPRLFRPELSLLSADRDESCLLAQLEKAEKAMRLIDAIWGKPGRQDLIQRATFKSRGMLLLDLANMQEGEDAFKWFSGKWRTSVGEESAESCWELRIDLRFIWTQS